MLRREEPLDEGAAGVEQCKDSRVKIKEGELRAIDGGEGEEGVHIGGRFRWG